MSRSVSQDQGDHRLRYRRVLPARRRADGNHFAAKFQLIGAVRKAEEQV